MSEHGTFGATFVPVGGMRFETAIRLADGRHDHSEGVFCDVNGTWPDGASIFCERTTFQQIDDHGRLVERAEWDARRDATRRATPLDRDALVALICGEPS